MNQKSPPDDDGAAVVSFDAPVDPADFVGATLILNLTGSDGPPSAEDVDKLNFPGAGWVGVDERDVGWIMIGAPPGTSPLSGTTGPWI